MVSGRFEILMTPIPIFVTEDKEHIEISFPNTIFKNITASSREEAYDKAHHEMRAIMSSLFGDFDNPLLT